MARHHGTPLENLTDFHDTFQVEEKPTYSDFGPKITSDDLPQSRPERRKNLKRSCRKAHLLTASACLSLAKAHAIPILDSGLNLHHLGESTLYSHDPFKSDSASHVLETETSSGSSISTLNHEAFVRKMQLQYFDTMEPLWKISQISMTHSR